MKIKILTLLAAFMMTTFTACGSEEPKQDADIPADDKTEAPEKPGDTPTPGGDGDSKVIVAYFSWGGTTKRMAEEIQAITGADIFRIEPVVPYPTQYTPCTEVAREEKDKNARPAIKDKVENWNKYDIVYIGCPVWWWTTPMIIHTFCESYDFKGKTVVPFCTYASTYRDETLAEIVNSTPDAKHLAGEGLTSGAINTGTIKRWIDLNTEEYNNRNPK